MNLCHNRTNMDHVAVLLVVGLIVTIIVFDRRLRSLDRRPVYAQQTVVPSQTLVLPATRFTLFSGRMGYTGPVTISVFTHCVCVPGTALRLRLHGMATPIDIFDTENCESTFTVNVDVDTVAILGQTMFLSVFTPDPETMPCRLSDITVVLAM